MLGLPEGVTACLFDLDGVLTKTADVHAYAWKAMFDEFFAAHAGEPGVDTSPFELPDDYLAHVDGKPRYDGVRDMLAARGFALPEGADGDDPALDTVRSLGDRKNDQVLGLIASKGVEPYEGSVKYLEAARDAGLRIAVVSSSANAAGVLEAAGLSHFVEARVDGVVAAEQGIAGKPAPDMFNEAAHLLGVPTTACVVFEDAISGVQAGAAGQFAAVIGVDRGGHATALAAAGATQVVDDLAQLLATP